MATNVSADVAKKTFEAAIVFNQGKITRGFALNKSGVNEFRNWLKKHDIELVHLWIEATGRDSNALAQLAYDKGWQVTIVNPRCIRHFAKAKLKLNKNDKLDAKVILAFANSTELGEFHTWKPKTNAQNELRDVQVEILGLKKSLTQERNRSKCGIVSEFVRQSIARTINHLKERIKALQKESMRLIRSDSTLLRTYRVLEKVPGFGPVTIAFLLGKVDFDAFRKGRQLVKFAGLNTIEWESGTSVWKRPRISRAGHADLRSALYWPAIVAIRDDEDTAEFARQIEERSKCKMVAICAVMARQLRIAFAKVRDDRRVP